MEVCILAKTLLILGAGPDQCPGIIKANQMGLKTLVLDGNPDALGKQYAAQFHTVNIKDVREVEVFIEKNQHIKIDGVIAFGVDIPYIIARAASLLKVNYTITEDVAKLSEDKLLSKECMETLGINIPVYQSIQSEQEIYEFILLHGFPVIIKPVDNSAARGISYINQHSDISNAYQEAFKHTKNKAILIEKYLAGPQISSESLIVNGDIYHIGFADRNYSQMERFLPSIIEDGGDLPSLYLQPHHQDTYSRQLQKLVKALAIKNAVIKGDLVIYNDKLHIIEFALRLSGGNFSTIEIPESTGIDLLKASIKLHLNETIYPETLTATRHQHVSLRYKFAEDSQAGTIRNISYPKITENIILQMCHAQIDDTIPTQTTDHAKRIGFVIAKGDSREKACENAQKQLQKIRLTID